jgi:hypothetical protein
MHLKQNGTGVSTGENDILVDTSQTNGMKVPRIKLKTKISQGGAPPTLPPENLEEILAELPNVTDDLVPLSLVVDRVVQDAYAKLNEMADT